METILVGMSGGLDSSVTAALLQDQGYRVAGVSIVMFDDSSSCSGEKDREDARRVCEILGIDHHIYDYREEFADKVIKNFAQEYQAGRTPNPCVDCNREIKFAAIVEAADKFGYDKIATGHYASIDYDQDRNRYLLKQSKDLSKDQTYFLYNLKQEELARIVFPLEGYSKEQVRQIARDKGLPVYKKPESQDICFIKDGNYEAYLKDKLAMETKAGNFLDKDGNILGQHKGHINYTIGQRKGLGISLGKPAYVIEIRPNKNEVVIGDNDDLYSTTMEVKDVNLIYQESLSQPLKAGVKTRYSHKISPATIKAVGDHIRVDFDQGVRAITAGQAAVFYLGTYVLGGGTII